VSILFALALVVAVWWTIRVHEDAYRLGLQHGRERAELEPRHPAERDEMSPGKKSAWEVAKARWRL
jgi:hypothetical protein